MATVPIVAIAAAAPAVAIAAAAPDVPVASAAPDVPVAAAAPDVPVAAAAPDVPVADATASTGVHQPMEGKEQTHMEKLFAMHEVRMLLDTALRMKLVDEKGIDTIMEDMHSGRFTTQHYDTMWRSLINAASIKPVIPSTTFTPPVPVPVPALVPIEAPSAVGLPGAGDGSLVRQAPVKAPSAEAPPGFRPIISDRQTTRQLVRASSRPLYAARAASAASMVLMRAAAKEAMDGNLPRQARLEALRYTRPASPATPGAGGQNRCGNLRRSRLLEGDRSLVNGGCQGLGQEQLFGAGSGGSRRRRARDHAACGHAVLG
jgi:hypothetical protein